MKHLLLLISTFLCVLTSRNTMAQGFSNGDFELWTSKTTYEIDSNWSTSNQFSLAEHDTLTVWKVPGFSGQAIHIQTAIIGIDTLAGFIQNAPDGVPYTQQPSAITGYYRYSLPGNDSAILYVAFKKAGVILSENFFHIRGTGSLPTFTAFSFPLLPLSMAPDSVMILATSSNLLSNTGIESGSWLELDQLTFTGPGITQIIEGGSFDSWLPTTTDMPNGWSAGMSLVSNGISKSTDHYSGSYSIKMETQSDPPYTFPAAINNGMNGMPYTQLEDTLTGYYKYTSTGGDSASVRVFLKSEGTFISINFCSLQPVATWTYFELPIAGPSLPDSAWIMFISGSSGAGVTSTLYLDHLQFKSQTTSVLGAFATVDKAIAFPNPAGNEVNIRIPHIGTGKTVITVSDVTKKVVGQWNYDYTPNIATILISGLDNGLYFYEVHTAESTFIGKFIKE